MLGFVNPGADFCEHGENPALCPACVRAPLAGRAGRADMSADVIMIGTDPSDRGLGVTELFLPYFRYEHPEG